MRWWRQVQGRTSPCAARSVGGHGGDRNNRHQGTKAPGYRQTDKQTDRQTDTPAAFLENRHQTTPTALGHSNRQTINIRARRLTRQTDRQNEIERAIDNNIYNFQEDTQRNVRKLTERLYCTMIAKEF